MTTVPQFFEQRYDEGTRRLVSIIVLLSYVVIMLPNILYAGAQVFVNIFGIDKMFGISRFAAIAIVCVATAIIGSIYAIFGGLKAIALSDSINGSPDRSAACWFRYSASCSCPASSAATAPSQTASPSSCTPIRPT